GPDTRDSDYRTDFVPSAGWQTRIPLDVVWLENGEADAILVRIDLIYSFDELTEAIGAELSARTGQNLTDSVFTFTNHSHSSYGPFTKATMLFFGGEFYREEVFQRIVDQAVDTAMAARAELQPAAIGLGILDDFDPDNQIFRSRRSENDTLLDPHGEVTGPGHKDDRVSMLRVDGTNGEPIAALFAFGIHGTIMDSDNPLITTEAPGHISLLLNQRYGGPRWIFAQGAGGDVSPAGSDDGFARMESIAERAAERLVELYDSIELSSEPLILDPVQRYVSQGRDIRVTRNDTVDFHYLQWDPSWAESGYYPDSQVWEGEPGTGGVKSPIDEFWPEHGAALCGETDLDIPMFGLDVDLPAYASCLDLEKGFTLFRIAFQSYIATLDDYPLPLPESRTALLGSLGLSGIPVTRPGEETSVEDLVIAFAPGEATTLWTQFLRHRAASEKDVQELLVLGYSMDHEGYLLTVEDWLMAGYEPAITWWGPLQGEYLLEQLLDVVEIAASPVKEDPAWPEFPTESWYPDWDTPVVEPDATSEAGQLADPLPDYVYVRDGAAPVSPSPEPALPRMQGIARWTFFGHDPAMGLVDIVLERENSAGEWEPVLSPGGEAVTDATPAILVTYTPRPLSGTAEVTDPIRQHLYHVEWQAVDTAAGLDQAPGAPLGNYRLRASGLRRDPADLDYPYDGIPWEANSEVFEVVPAELNLQAELEGSTVVLDARYASASRGSRHLHPIAGAQDQVPVLEGPLGISVSPGSLLSSETSGASTVLRVDCSQLDSGAQTLTVGDGWGNTGTITVALP
ncbi:MAG: neutral/alkaline non-lysosomal ceramidase N-terminal domain-containing protein, partial [Myxococcota bacterium]|nr:neutral/alkaline non-lysosomal ceramidase N-terminal domain-containing protein [Myxococcota bacterium]